MIYITTTRLGAGMREGTKGQRLIESGGSPDTGRLRDDHRGALSGGAACGRTDTGSPVADARVLRRSRTPTPPIRRRARWADELAEGREVTKGVPEAETSAYTPPNWLKVGSRRTSPSGPARRASRRSSNRRATRYSAARSRINQGDSLEFTGSAAKITLPVIARNVP